MMTETTACSYCQQTGHTHLDCDQWKLDGHPVDATPPSTSTTLLDTAIKLATQAIEDAEDALDAMLDDAPVWAHVDLVTAIGHLRLAIGKLNQAAGRINEAVTR